MADLARFVQDLPAELYYMILDHVATPDESTTIVIDKHYQPPSALQINRKTREQYAKAYYGSDAVFQFLDPVSFISFMANIKAEHYRLIKQVQFVMNLPPARYDSHPSHHVRIGMTGVERSVQNLIHIIQMRKMASSPTASIELTYRPPFENTIEWEKRARIAGHIWVRELGEGIEKIRQAPRVR